MNFLEVKLTVLVSTYSYSINVFWRWKNIDFILLYILDTLIDLIICIKCFIIYVWTIWCLSHKPVFFQHDDHSKFTHIAQSNSHCYIVYAVCVNSYLDENNKLLYYGVWKEKTVKTLVYI